jgi:hypothetical protein
VIAGGPSPLIAAWLLGRYQSGVPIAVFILASAIMTLFATAAFTDRTNRELAG